MSTYNSNCQCNFVSPDCAGLCTNGVGNFVDDCGDCVTEGQPNPAYLDSCIGGRTWTSAEKALNGLV